MQRVSNALITALPFAAMGVPFLPLWENRTSRDAGIRGGIRSQRQKRKRARWAGHKGRA
jgi:hypothetical protein